MLSGSFKSREALAPCPIGIAPVGYSLDQAKRDQAEPEIYHQPEIHLERHVARRWRQIPSQQEIGCVSRQDGNQGVEKIGC